MLTGAMQWATQALALVAGVWLVGVSMLSVVRFYVLPRSVPDAITHNVFRLLRAVFHARLRWVQGEAARDRVMAYYAPTVVLVLPLVWLTLIAAGFALVMVGLGQPDVQRAFVVSGSSMLTLGFVSETALRFYLVEFAAATLGLLLVALLIAYLPTMYGAFSRREIMVNAMETYGGTPPTAWQMLVRLQGIHALNDLDAFWQQWRLWFAEVEESHTSLSPLVFFRSCRPDRFWLVTAGAVLDAAALYVSCVQLANTAQAQLCLRSGFLALRYMADMFAVAYDPDPAPTDPISITRDEFDQAWATLADAKVPLVADRDAAWRAYAGWRVNYDRPLLALANITMAPVAPWVSDRSLAALQPRADAFLRRRVRPT